MRRRDLFKSLLGVPSIGASADTKEEPSRRIVCGRVQLSESEIRRLASYQESLTAGLIEGGEIRNLIRRSI